MSGHSKWSQIKRQKEMTDAIKSRTFSKYARMIALESKNAGGVLTTTSLASAIARARAANMPKDNIERAIAKGISKEHGSIEPVLYEAYGPAGIAIIVLALTNNKNRTTQEIKHLFSKHDAELSAPGAAIWAFTKNPDGTFVANGPLFEVTGKDEAGLSALLEELDDHEDVQCVYTNAIGYENIGN